MGIFDRLRNAKGRRLAARNLIADELWKWAIDERRIFRGMGEEDESRLRELSREFLAAKRFDPVGGAEIDDRLKISVATQACLPLLGLDMSWYRGFSTIFVTPDAYTIKQRWTDEWGIVNEYEEEVAGEAFSLGPVALSIPDIDASGWGDGYNVVIHEMAHRLDSLDGAFDGRPPLHANMDGSRWGTVFTEAWEDLNAKLNSQAGGGRSRHRGTSKRRTRIDPYAAESPDEFFAVVCEYFWENPSILLREYPAVYEQLKLFFRRDPSTWRR
ncbi:MAG TPA: M90 family metallopeptidase [Rectinemataceae bacterium]|nr:M90 family metallopeptidase [Rectinemataceae bacterium]